MYYPVCASVRPCLQHQLQSLQNFGPRFGARNSNPEELVFQLQDMGQHSFSLLLQSNCGKLELQNANAHDSIRAAHSNPKPSQWDPGITVSSLNDAPRFRGLTCVFDKNVALSLHFQSGLLTHVHSFIFTCKLWDMGQCWSVRSDGDFSSGLVITWGDLLSSLDYCGDKPITQ